MATREVVPQSSQSNGLGCRPVSGHPLKEQRESEPTSNPSTKKNPGEAATSHGVQSSDPASKTESRQAYRRSRDASSEAEIVARKRWNYERFRWEDRVTENTTLSNAANRVASYLSRKFFFVSDGVYMAQETLAKALRIHVRTVQRAINQLVAAGFLAVKTFRGRSNANFYSFVRETSDRTKTVDQIPAENAAVSSQKHGVDAVPTNANSTISPIAPTALTASRPNSIQDKHWIPARFRRASSPSRESGSRRLSGPVAERFAESEVRSALSRVMGEASVRSYLDPAAWRMHDRTVVCGFELAAHRLAERAERALSQLGVSVVWDRDEHRRLMDPVSERTAV